MTTHPSAPETESAKVVSSHADDMIRLHSVVKTYKNAAGEFKVLKGIDLTIRRGEFVAIVVKSGSGKSTLLNMITGFESKLTTGILAVFCGRMEFLDSKLF